MKRPWMPLYVADYLRDTRRLSTVEHGAYLLLIMEYWTSGGLPSDDDQLRRITGMTAGEWRRSKENLQSFFFDGWKHKRLDAELARSSEISSKRSASAKIKHANAAANAGAKDAVLHTHTGATSQSQSQLQNKEERKKDAATAAVLPFDALPTKQKTPEEQVKSDYYAQFREILGSSGPAMATKLLRAKGGNVWQAMSALGAAREAGDFKSYLGRIIAGAHDPATGIHPGL